MDTQTLVNAMIEVADALGEESRLFSYESLAETIRYAAESIAEQEGV